MTRCPFISDRTKSATALLIWSILFASVAVAETPAAKNAVARPAATAKAAAPAAAESTADIAALLSRAYEERARELLERYVPQREFQVTVNAAAGAKPLKRAPYEPKSVTTTSIANMSLDELKAISGLIQVDLAISNRLAPSRKKLEELLVKSLKLEVARGDKIVVSSLGIELPDEGWSKEKSELKQELSLLKSENDKLNRELAVSNQQVKTLQNQEKSSAGNNGGGNNGNGNQPNPADPLSEDMRKLVLGGAGALLFLILIGLFLFGRSISKAGRSLGTAISAIAASMENVGGQIAGSRPSEEGGIKTLEAKMISEGGGGRGNGQQSLASLPIDSIHAHLLKVRNEIQENLNDASEAIILRHITMLCTTPQTVGRAVVAMELLGRDIATDLFRRLGIVAQEAVLLFLREGTYDKSKIELMLEAGEEIKTKLLVQSFDNARGKPSEQVAQRLIQLSDEDLALVSIELDPSLLPRLFLYLDPGKIAKILAALKRFDVTLFEKAISVLSKMPDVEALSRYDEDISRALDVMLEKMKADGQRPFLKVYQDIVEASDDEVGETIVRELSSDKRLGDFFKENVINIHTLFRLTEESRSQMLEAFSNKDVAALATGVDETERQTLFDSLPARRESLVSEEYDSLVSRGGKNAEEAFKKVKDQIVKRLRDMKTGGTLASSMVQDAPSESDSRGSRSRAPANEAPESEPAEEEAPQDEETPAEEDGGESFGSGDPGDESDEAA